MLRPSPNHGTQWLPNDDDDYMLILKLVQCNRNFRPRMARALQRNTADVYVTFKYILASLHAEVGMKYLIIASTNPMFL